MVIVESVLQCQVLHVGANASVQQRGRLADALVLHLRSVQDDGALHTLAHQGDVVPLYGGQSPLAQVVDPVGNQYEKTLRQRVSILAVGLFEGLQQALSIAGFHH